MQLVVKPVATKFVNGEQKLEKIENEGINKLYNYIKNNPNTRLSKIEKELKVPQKTLERWVKILKTNNKIEFRGSKKTGGYYAL
jgi:ATP-dependent DNA helicase RecG